MNKTAYVVLAFRTPTKPGEKPEFLGASILSEDAVSVTHSSKILPLDLWQSDGEDYEAACRSVLEDCQRYREFRWVLPYLSREVGHGFSWVDPPLAEDASPIAKTLDNAINLGVSAAYPIVFGLPCPDPPPDWKAVVRKGWRMVTTTARETVKVLRKKG